MDCKLSEKHFDESTVYRVAHAFEQATNYHKQKNQCCKGGEKEMEFETVIGLEVHVELKKQTQKNFLRKSK
ncbi:hypothetical protein GCM10020331_015620 [Ectobacillus funiculus]